MSEKEKYYVFDPIIYPRKIFVIIDGGEIKVDDFFENFDGTKLEWKYQEEFGNTTIPEVQRKDTKEYGELIVFSGITSMTPSEIAHESFHCIETIFDQIGIDYEKERANEPWAYMMGWIVGEITKLKDKLQLEEPNKETPASLYMKYKNTPFIYKKDSTMWMLAGYANHYAILGSNDDIGCIKQFNDSKVVYEPGYKSYRFAKIKNISLMQFDHNIIDNQAQS